ncbi:hypothetical protein CO613_08555 [Lysobacteraceae bacterium NML07-0707]|nr:hypothetical protein CO613_08555 [Xanthomonadaceae bacterium NML07-0707]
MKTLPMLLCSLFLAPLAAGAADAETEHRLARLEAEVRHLQARIQLLEDERRHYSRFNTDTLHVCRINAFTRTYEGESSHPGLARRQAQKACERENDAMFCRTENIRCNRY